MRDRTSLHCGSTDFAWAFLPEAERSSLPSSWSACSRVDLEMVSLSHLSTSHSRCFCTVACHMSCKAGCLQQGPAGRSIHTDAAAADACLLPVSRVIAGMAQHNMCTGFPIRILIRLLLLALLTVPVPTRLLSIIRRCSCNSIEVLKMSFGLCKCMRPPAASGAGPAHAMARGASLQHWSTRVPIVLAWQQAARLPQHCTSTSFLTCSCFWRLPCLSPRRSVRR